MDYFFISAQITFGILSPVILVTLVTTFGRACVAMTKRIKDRHWDKSQKTRELRVDNVFEGNNPDYVVLFIKDQLGNTYETYVKKAKIRQVVK